VNSEQFTAIVKQSQLRFGCTEAQAMRLAKSFAADMRNSMMVAGKVPGETGLAALRFPEGVNWSAMTPAIRLVRFLQCIEEMDRANIGVSHKWKPELMPEMDTWLRKTIELDQAKPITPLGASNPPADAPEAFRRCRCGRPAIPGDDVCYICKSE
jgi:hypothetical protein